MKREDLSGTKELEFFNDFWKLYKAYHDPEGTEEYWDSLIYAASEVILKYKGEDCEQFAKDVIQAMLAQLERVYRKE